MSDDLYIGLMSGTSLDAVDAVITRFDANPIVLASVAHPFPEGLRHRLQQFIVQPEATSLDDLGHAGRELAATYAEAVAAVLRAAQLNSQDIRAIGCHGQTLRHNPNGPSGFTLQLGDAAALAITSGIAVVSDFRSADIALGGQGAPLVPAFHQAVFGIEGTSRAIVNMGGIANITALQANGDIVGCDTGPGNTLLDLWCEQHTGKRHDANGAWAASGSVNDDLLGMLLTDPFFAAPPPKSTGREHFNRTWLQRFLDSAPNQIEAADVQATLVELTAVSIADVAADIADGSEIYLCGGGASNSYLVSRIAVALPGAKVSTTATLGIDPDMVEAAAFAWLARARLNHEPGNVTSITGASRPAILGALHAP